MSRFYEKELPQGYTEALIIDANDKKSSLKIRIAAAAVTAVLINLIFFLYVLPRFSAVKNGFSVIKCLVLIVSYFVYVILHELTHGAVYKLLTKQKLTYGFKPPAAFCGVPDIYVYRITSLMSLLAPFTIFSVLFAVLFFVIPDPFSKMLVLLMFSLHLTGCAGDLYGAGLLLFRFKNPETLRKDTGPKQIYYTKD
ncbi:MAG: DUF3267 domain-containing protein [Clostridia bacterium]|nr:DUF3267 domain-containing protein [Clostridia bacterium]